MREEGKRNDWRATVADDIHVLGVFHPAFLFPEHVEGSYNGCALSAVVVETKKLEAGISRCAEVAFDVVFICQKLQSAACLEKAVCHICHTSSGKEVFEDVEVGCLVYACIEWAFTKVGKGAPLPQLVCHERCVSHLFYSAVGEGIVDKCIVWCTFCGEVTGTQHQRQEIVCRLWCRLVPCETSCPTLYVIVAVGIPRPSATYRCSAIDATVVARMVPPVNKVAAPCHPVAGRLVAGSKHTEGRMVAVLAYHALCLFKQITVDGHASTEFYAMVGPRRSFGLKIQSELVGCTKGSFGRAIGMETYMVYAIFLALCEYPRPRSFVGGRIASKREAAVVHSASQPYRLAVEVKLSSAEGYLPHSKCRGHGVAAKDGGKGVQIWGKLTP